MPKRLTFLIAAAFAVATALPVMAQEPSVDTVVATVNGTDITMGHVLAMRAGLPPEYDTVPDEALFEPIIGQLVQQAVLEQSLNGDASDYVRFALENERRALMAAQVLESMAGDAVTEAEIQLKFDEAHPDGLQGPEEYRAQHILVDTLEEAQAIKADLDAGADFTATAQEKSTGPSGPRGGDLGWFGTGQMVPSFEAAVLELEPGQVSDPVETQFGWHVILLNETRTGDTTAEEAQIKAQLRDELTNAYLLAKIDEMVAGAAVDRFDADMDPSALSTVTLDTE